MSSGNLENELDEIMSEIFMVNETELIKGMLPDHYTCEPRKNGIHFYSDKGMDGDLWKIVFKGFKGIFKDRFMEVNHSICTNHMKFTLYLKPLTTH